MKSNSANMIEEEKRDDDANYNSQQAKRFTDPTSSYQNVKDQFQKIQQNFTNMRKGISKTKT